VAKSSKKPSLASEARIVANFLRKEYADAKCALEFKTPFQLLIATILSAQCTDERVNIVTENLFAKCPSAKEMAAIKPAELEKLIQSAGFFRNKAKNILACSKRLVEEFGGDVPQSLEMLVTLPGVGRKTANVVLGTAFGIPSGVVVDTHVTRLTNRMGLTKNEDAVKIEQDLMAILPQEEWIDFAHRLIHHGRRVCGARKPDCEHCGLRDACPKVGVALATKSPNVKKPLQSTAKIKSVRRPSKVVKS
jgi:endonuclease III